MKLHIENNTSIPLNKCFVLINKYKDIADGTYEDEVVSDTLYDVSLTVETRNNEKYFTITLV